MWIWIGLCFRISEAVRIAGSLVFILLLFILTAVLVKVPMEEDLFFSVTMATIWFINCKSLCQWRRSGGVSVYRRVVTSPVPRSLRGRSAGQPLRPGGSAATEVQHHLHERPGPRWDLRCRRHAACHSQWATHMHARLGWMPESPVA